MKKNARQSDNGNGSTLGGVPVESPDAPSGDAPVPDSSGDAGPDAPSGDASEDSEPDTGATPIDTPKRRGRPKGYKNKPKPESARASRADSIAGIEKLLLNLHFMGAKILASPELRITPEESHDLAAAAVEVAMLYNFNASEKTIAWTNLAVVMGAVYGTRLYVILDRKEEEKKKIGKLELVK
jgi:hypothetical protein